ncbi:hypothetical protein DSO57_1005435 [Entomophthora muscae]|uniref:Uncharacterized protein n=1 Tax=Entomophthora muscae TaxID=34485 RepID=A0ACC2SKX7_9FUNG|nr:hypothetical protein DSO57_1005435 [Entomophthora muscae]
MKTFSVILSLLAFSAQARPLTNEAASEATFSGHHSDVINNDYEPIVPDYEPVTVVPDYEPAHPVPDYENQDGPEGDDCFGGVGSSSGSGKHGISIRKGRCKSKIRVKQGLHGTRINVKAKASFKEINL